MYCTTINSEFSEVYLREKDANNDRDCDEGVDSDPLLGLMSEEQLYGLSMLRSQVTQEGCMSKSAMVTKDGVMFHVTRCFCDENEYVYGD